MPVPPLYQRASDEFNRFLLDARNQSMLESTHQAYTMTQGVLQAFRRRLGFKDAILFASALPPILRAVFVDDWDLDEPIRPFGTREEMTKDVQSLRADHNYAPDSTIRDVAVALRKNIDESALDEVLSRLPAGAAGFWRV